MSNQENANLDGLTHEAGGPSGSIGHKEDSDILGDLLIEAEDDVLVHMPRVDGEANAEVNEGEEENLEIGAAGAECNAGIRTQNVNRAVEPNLVGIDVVGAEKPRQHHEASVHQQPESDLNLPSAEAKVGYAIAKVEETPRSYAAYVKMYDGAVAKPSVEISRVRGIIQIQGEHISFSVRDGFSLKNQITVTCTISVPSDAERETIQVIDVDERTLKIVVYKKTSGCRPES